MGLSSAASRHQNRIACRNNAPADVDTELPATDGRAGGIAGEVTILARRLLLSERLFSQLMVYRCVGPDGGCTIGQCSVDKAMCEAAGTGFSCNGVGAIFLCPDFLNRFGTTDERALVLVHESFASDLTSVPLSDTCPP